MQKDHNQSLTLEVRLRCRKTQERTTNVSPQNRANAQQMSDLRGEITMQKSTGVQVVEALGQPQGQLNALRPWQLLLLAVQQLLQAALGDELKLHKKKYVTWCSMP